jgi:hypothetical protein
MTLCAPARFQPADVDALGRHLDEEASAQREVLERLGEQEGLLVKNDVAGLKDHLVASDALLARLQTLTEARRRIVTALAQRIGLAVDRCSLDLILSELDEPARGEIAARASALRKAVEDVVRRTRRLTVLIRHASETNQALLHALLGDDAPLRPYLPDGRRATSSGMPHFARDF